MKPIASRRPRTERPKGLLLYVEDEAENREVARLRLSADYDLLFATNDVEACRLLAERGRDLAAVLMDIQLQGSALDGIALTRLVRGKLDRATLPRFAQDVPVLEVPILFVTAYGKKHPRTELDEAGGDELIAKPVDFVELTLALTRLHLAATTRRLAGASATEPRKRE